MVRRLVALAALTGCRIGFDELARLETCRWDPPSLGSIERIDAIVEPGVNLGDPTLSPDGLTLFYAREGTVMAARRDTLASPFGTGTPVPELASFAGRASGLFVEADGLTAYVSISSAGDAGLFVLDRSTVAEPFGAPRELAELASPGYEFNLRVLPDRQTAVFVRWLDNDDPTTADSYFVRRTAPGAPWTDLMKTPFSTTGIDAAAHPVPDGLVFETERALAITRGDLATGFTAASPLSVGPGYNGLPFVSPDGCELLFVSDRAGANQIYRATVE